MPIEKATPALEHFVRQTLGCTCPQEVFEQVDTSHSDRSRVAGARHRIAIGGRLLIYIADADGVESALARMPAWISAGRAERDAAQMNRWRLVLALPAASDDQHSRLQQAFDAGTPATDGRLHLHLLEPPAIADLLDQLGG